MTSKSGGPNPVVLLVGGPADVAREVRARLAKRLGLWVKYHLEYKKVAWGSRPLPKDVDLVIILKDMIGHGGERVIVEKCKSQTRLIPFIRTQRKWAAMGPALHARGFLSGKFPALVLDPGGVPVDLAEPEEPPRIERVEVEVQEPPEPHVLVRIHALAGELRDLLPAAGFSAVLVTDKGYEFDVAKR